MGYFALFFDIKSSKSGTYFIFTTQLSLDLKHFKSSGSLYVPVFCFLILIVHASSGEGWEGV